MSERWVLNASPLIVLARVGHADLFSKLVETVIVPDAVVAEIEAGPTGDPARRWLSTEPLPTVKTTSPPQLQAWDLGAGETAVLSYALTSPGSTAILDDGAARRCAHSFGIPCKGTLAVVILAKQHKLIPSAANVMRQLLTNGFRLDEAIIQKALSRTVKEPWP
jgi:predicted nucleic acid-binding protein